MKENAIEQGKYRDLKIHTCLRNFELLYITSIIICQIPFFGALNDRLFLVCLAWKHTN